MPAPSQLVEPELRRHLHGTYGVLGARTRRVADQLEELGRDRGL